MLNKNTLKGEIFEYICCQVSFFLQKFCPYVVFWKDAVSQDCFLKRTCVPTSFATTSVFPKLVLGCA